MDKQTLQGLTETKKHLQTQITYLQEDLQAVDHLLAKYSNGIGLSINDAPQLFNSRTDKSILKTAQAVRKLFSSAPEKAFFPLEVRDYLETLKSQNKIVTNSKSMLNATHTILRALLKSKFIEKISTGKREAKYKLCRPV